MIILYDWWSDFIDESLEIQIEFLFLLLIESDTSNFSLVVLDTNEDGSSIWIQKRDNRFKEGVTWFLIFDGKVIEFIFGV